MIALLYIFVLFSTAFRLYGMEEKAAAKDLSYIPNSITIRNNTNRPIQYFIIAEGMRYQWFKEKKTVIPDQYFYRFLAWGNRILDLKPNRLINIYDTDGLLQLKKKQTVHANTTVQTSFDQFQKNVHEINDSEEWIIYIEDANRRGIIALTLIKDMQDKKILDVILIKKSGRTRESVEFPSDSNSINFALDIKDGTDYKLEESDFCATIVR